VSPLGIFLDTTSDKVLVALTLTAMAIAGLCQAWIPLVIIGREFLISGLRSYAASCDRIISAHVWGKGKAAVTMVAIVLVLLAASGTAGGSLRDLATAGTWEGLRTASAWLLGLAGILTIVSGARYIVDAWPLFTASEVEPDVEEPRRIAAGRER
jgi:CDP-diacylglycerol--glycerol-3-phosphate 3-phosphatidyltransferase